MNIIKFKEEFVPNKRKAFMPTSLEMTNKAFLDEGV